MFIAAHNAGNEAVATLKVVIYLALDSVFATKFYNEKEEEKEEEGAYMVDAA